MWISLRLTHICRDNSHCKDCGSIGYCFADLYIIITGAILNINWSYFEYGGADIFLDSERRKNICIQRNKKNVH